VSTREAAALIGAFTLGALSVVAVVTVARHLQRD
jgi:hypothetical protein